MTMLTTLAISAYSMEVAPAVSLNSRVTFFFRRANHILS